MAEDVESDGVQYSKGGGVDYFVSLFFDYFAVLFPFNVVVGRGFAQPSGLRWTSRV